MGYFTLPPTNPNIKECLDNALSNIRLFKDSGYSYSYLLSAFTMSMIDRMIKLAEEENQEISFKPNHFNYNCDVIFRTKFIEHCFDLYKENDFKGIAILHTIKSEIQLAILQADKLPR